MRKLMLALAAVAVLGAGAVPATAGTAENPEITDIAGDANYLTRQAPNTDTRPASFDHADLRAIWLETTYDTVKVPDPDTGAIARVRYVPNALVYRVRTEAPIRPMPPTVSETHFVTSIGYEGGGSCRLGLTVKVFPSSMSRTLTIPAACRESGGTLNVGQGIGVSMSGNLLTMTVPFSVSEVGRHFVDGRVATLDPASSTIQFDGVLILTLLDDTPAGAPFVIGSDVPEDVECADEPGHPDCQ